MENLNVTILQSILHWEDVNTNLDFFTKKIQQINAPTDLIILPEMFTTGFSMQPENLAETMTGKTVNWMQKTAQEKNAVVTGSLIIKENKKFYNRLVWMRPDGTYAKYDKRHLFSLAGEHKSYSAGERKLIVDCKGWKICPLICYDLRFPVWSRNTVQYDALIYVANWPNKRSNAWKTLLNARAIENQCYTIGVNRVGEDANGHFYSGDSGIIDFTGLQMAQLSHIEGVLQVALDYKKQQKFRQKLNFLADQDKFKLEL